MVRVNNIGAIFISIFTANNIATMSHTKHIVIRYKYLNEHVEDRVVKIIFVESVENESDNFTKSLSAELHEKHGRKRKVRSLNEFLALKIFEVK